MCRKHVEIRKVLKDFMRLRKNISEEFTSENELPMYTRLTEMIDEALCKKNDEEKYHDLKFIKRECEICGVSQIKFSDHENREDRELFKWSRFKFVDVPGVENPNGTLRKRLSIVTKKTYPFGLVNYLKGLLEEHPYHQFMACWQREQFDSIKDSLPLNHVFCVHDFSENY